jgi:hypothetical protein
MGGDPAQPVTVHGGSAGITAQCEDIVAMARRFGGAAQACLASAFALHQYLVDPTVLSLALLDGVGFATFEADLLDALDGPQGLTWSAAECGAIDAELRVAAAAYETADRLYYGAHDVATGAVRLPAAVAAAAAVLVRTGDPIAAAEVAVARDPEVADVVIAALQVPALLNLLARTIPDGHGVADPLGIDASGTAARPPRRLTDLIAGLARRNDDPHHGTVDVRLLTLPDGTRRAIVDITGTKSWTPLPTRDVTSLSTNGRALVGERTAYEQGVLAAMRQAGVRQSDDVMLIGHSEGGMVAVTTARDTAASGEFNVTHIITAGAPLGLTVGTLPSRIQVLALENARDVVPHLDGVANPDEPNVTTASSARGDSTVHGDHDLRQSYLPLARDVEAAGDRSIRDFLAGSRDFLRANTVETRTFQVQRRY